jgi:hypothetical protein
MSAAEAAPAAPDQVMTWPERIENYSRTMRRSAYLTIEHGWVYGMWIIGNSYKKRNSYYGGYQGDFLKRIAALFPDKRRALHAFSGMVELDALPGDTVDIRPELLATFTDDCQTLECVPLGSYDLVVADPPYSTEDAEHYGTAMVDRTKVMRALQRVPIGAHVVWLDQVSPMYTKATFIKEAVIGLIGSTNHRFRVVTIFRRHAGEVVS